MSSQEAAPSSVDSVAASEAKSGLPSALEVQSASSWEAFLDSTGVGTWVSDAETGVIHCSKGWAAMLGYSLEELAEMNDPWTDLIHPEDRARVISLHLEHVDGSGGCYENEQRMLHRSGEYVWVLSRCRVEADRMGRTVRSWGCQIDISGLKQRASSYGQLGIIRSGYVQQAPVQLAVFDRQKKEFIYWTRQEDAETLWRALPHRNEGEIYLFLLRGEPGDVLTVGEEGAQEQIELFEVDSDEASLIGAVIRALPREMQELAAARKAVGALHGRLRALRNENRSLESLASSLQDTRTRLEKLSQLDALTGLLNRRAFDERLEDLLEEGGDFSVLLVDIDHFKNVNDSFGHQVGDTVLKEAAQTLRSAQSTGQDVARIGGEEFAWILPGTPLSAALEAAERVRLAFAAETWVSGALTISVGVARSRDTDTAASLCARADRALYAAKRGGRNQVRSEDASDKGFRAA